MYQRHSVHLSLTLLMVMQNLPGISSQCFIFDCNMEVFSGEIHRNIDNFELLQQNWSIAKIKQDKWICINTSSVYKDYVTFNEDNPLLGVKVEMKVKIVEQFFCKTDSFNKNNKKIEIKKRVIPKYSADKCTFDEDEDEDYDESSGTGERNVGLEQKVLLMIIVLLSLCIFI